MSAPTQAPDVFIRLKVVGLLSNINEAVQSLVAKRCHQLPLIGQQESGLVHRT